MSLILRNQVNPLFTTKVSFLTWYGRMSRVVTKGPGDRGSIPGRVLPKIQKMGLDTALLKTQHNKIRFKE